MAAKTEILAAEDEGQETCPQSHIICSQPDPAEQFPQAWLDYLVESSQMPGHRLQDSLDEARSKVFSHKSLEVVCSSYPLTWFLSVRIFQAVLVVIAVLLLFAPPFESALWSLASLDQSQGGSRLFRFTARRLRNGLTGSAITSPGVQSFGVLQGDCLIPRYPQGDANVGGHLYVDERRGASVTLKSDVPLSFDGLYILTSNTSSEFDPVEFTLESSSDGEHWTVYVMPSMLSLDRAVPVPVGQDVAESDFSRLLLPLQRNQLVKIDWNAITCRWHAYASVVVRFFQASGLLLLGACAYQGKLHVSVQASVLVTFFFTFE